MIPEAHASALQPCVTATKAAAGAAALQGFQYLPREKWGRVRLSRLGDGEKWGRAWRSGDVYAFSPLFGEVGRGMDIGRPIFPQSCDGARLSTAFRTYGDVLS